jgi:hypothetical protein
MQADPFPAEPAGSLNDDRRLVGRVLRHWTERAALQGFPRLEDIDPWMIGADWTNCLLVAIRSPLELSHFVMVGDTLLFRRRRRLDGTAITLCPPDTLAGVLVSYLPALLSARHCLIVEGAAMQQGAAILHRSALLPLSENGLVIDHVLGAANHRPLRAGEPPPAETRLIWADPVSRPAPEAAGAISGIGQSF